MPYVIAFLGIKDGQGVTTTAIAVADALARSHSTVFLDCDMAGTGTAVDALHLNPERKGMNALLGEVPISAQMLIREAIPTRNPNLSVVPGLLAICGSDVVTLADRLITGKALAHMTTEFVVLDLGSPWAHPWLASARAAAQAVARMAHRVFVVFQDSPPRMARAIQVLKVAQPPKAELLLVESRRGALGRQVREAIRHNLPDLALSATIRWDPKRAMTAEDRGVPLPGLGESLVRTLRLVEAADVGDGIAEVTTAAGEAAG